MSSKSRRSQEARVPRYNPKFLPENSSVYMPGQVHDNSQPNFAFVSCPNDALSGLSPCWPSVTSAFYPGNDGSHLATLSIDPISLPNGPYMDSDICSASSYEMDSSYDVYTSHGSIPQPQMVSISPPLSQAEVISQDLRASPIQSGLYYQNTDPWVHGMLTPPDDAMCPDSLEIIDPGRPEFSFSPLPEPASECEYLGVSKLQPYRGNKFSQPRPIRSASEKRTSSRSTSQDSHNSQDSHSDKAKNNPRNDPRYDVKPDKDGLFHCPYARDGCSHKPTKQKCIYAKNLDSHLKPYTCKFGATDENCRSQRFSSNACLFRHEREMHGLHNHGMNPYLCRFQGCERARPDNGFPRRWNQRDHMKRVHGWDEPDNCDDGAERGVTDSARRRKSGNVSHAVPMKRAGSARMMPYPTGDHRHSSSVQRWSGRTPRELDTHNIMFAPALGDIRCSPTAFVAQQYAPGLFMHGY